LHKILVIFRILDFHLMNKVEKDHNQLLIKKFGGRLKEAINLKTRFYFDGFFNKKVISDILNDNHLVIS
jgi:hypothetical protein